jgi:ribosomal protein S17E
VLDTDGRKSSNLKKVGTKSAAKFEQNLSQKFEQNLPQKFEQNLPHDFEQNLTCQDKRRNRIWAEHEFLAFL